MIYLFSGNDSDKKIKAYEEFLESLPEETEMFSVSRNDFNRMQIESLYSGSGLFFTKSAAIFSNIFEYEETREFILDKLDLMGKSSNYFIFLEGKLNKPILDAFKTARAELNIFELPKDKLEKFNNFLVANAFGRKDKLNTWIYFRQAIDKGVGMEEIIGVLFWKIKDMMLRKDFNKFSEDELRDSAAKISYLLPQARKKNINAESAFEQFLLEIF